MNSSRIQLKRPSGWFAAGREVQQAATLLSDGAFKLFFWVCLHAGRASGSLCASTPELARALRKTENDIERSIEELIQALKTQYTIVIVTHNMQQAGRVSDFTAFFYLGKLIEFGPTVKIFTNPGEKQTEDYITGRFG